MNAALRIMPAFGFLCKARPLLLQIGGSPLMGRAADQRHRKSRFNMPYPTLTAFNLFKCMSLESEVQVLSTLRVDGFWEPFLSSV